MSSSKLKVMHIFAKQRSHIGFLAFCTDCNHKSDKHDMSPSHDITNSCSGTRYVLQPENGNNKTYAYRCSHSSVIRVLTVHNLRFKDIRNASIYHDHKINIGEVLVIGTAVVLNACLCLPSLASAQIQRTTNKHSEQAVTLPLIMSFNHLRSSHFGIAVIILKPMPSFGAFSMLFRPLFLRREMVIRATNKHSEQRLRL